MFISSTLWHRTSSRSKVSSQHFLASCSAHMLYIFKVHSLIPGQRRKNLPFCQIHVCRYFMTFTFLRINRCFCFYFSQRYMYFKSQPAKKKRQISFNNLWSMTNPRIYRTQICIPGWMCCFLFSPLSSVKNYLEIFLFILFASQKQKKWRILSYKRRARKKRFSVEQ